MWCTENLCNLVILVRFVETVQLALLISSLILSFFLIPKLIFILIYISYTPLKERMALHCSFFHIRFVYNWFNIVYPKKDLFPLLSQNISTVKSLSLFVLCFLVSLLLDLDSTLWGRGRRRWKWRRKRIYCNDQRIFLKSPSIIGQNTDICHYAAFYKLPWIRIYRFTSSFVELSQFFYWTWKGCLGVFKDNDKCWQRTINL